MVVGCFTLEGQAYYQQWQRCGKPDCECMTDADKQHGPYWYACDLVTGQVRCIGEELPLEVQKARKVRDILRPRITATRLRLREIEQALGRLDRGDPLTPADTVAVVACGLEAALIAEYPPEIREQCMQLALEILQGVDLEEVDPGKLRLPGADLRNADLGRAKLRGVDLSAAYLSGIDLSKADLTGAGLCRANLHGANLQAVNLVMADLRWADLRTARISQADLGSADLTGADLARTDLSHTNLSHAILYRATLSQADLSQADLRGADLRNTCLRGANLRGADLQEAILNEADLYEATVTIEQLAKAKSLSGATLPNGTHCDTG